MRLASQVALITGGSGGFGQAICQRFIEEGSTVVLADIDEEKLVELEPKYHKNSNQLKCMTTLTRRFKHRLLRRQLQAMTPFQEMLVRHIRKTTALASKPRHY